MRKKVMTVRTEDCPCGGKHAWMWHKQRGYEQCEHSRAVKYSNFRRWNQNVMKEEDRVISVLSQDPANIPWLEGESIYLDEEEVMA